MKKENRDKRFNIRVKPSEWDFLVRESEDRGQVVAEYVRAVLFANAILMPAVGRK